MEGVWLSSKGQGEAVNWKEAWNRMGMWVKRMCWTLRIWVSLCKNKREDFTSYIPCYLYLLEFQFPNQEKESVFSTDVYERITE